MHLLSSRIFVQTASAPNVRPASITTSQNLHSARTQRDCQSETFHSPTPREHNKKEKTNQGEKRHRSRSTMTLPRVAKSSTQLTNISISITEIHSLPFFHFISLCLSFAHCYCFHNFGVTYNVTQSA